MIDDWWKSAGAPGVAPGLLGSQFTGDFGFAASTWQQITAPDPNRPKTGLTAFGVFAWAHPRAAYQDILTFTGLYYWGPWIEATLRFLWFSVGV